MTNVVEVEGLQKSYGSRRAVREMSFTVAEGEVVGLLGPNGAGKTTTVEILEGLRRRDAGTVSVLGHDPGKRNRWLTSRVGVVPQQAGFDEVLSVRGVVKLYASFYRPRRSVDEVIEEVGLNECAKQRLTHLSGGQRRRVDLALALVGDPRVLFLDEPTTGFDPAARRRTWDVIARLRDRGVAVLLTSHYLDEVQQLADRVVVLRAGQIVADDAPDRIAAHSGHGAVITFRIENAAALPVGPWELVSGTHGMTTLTTEDPTAAMRVLTTWAVECGLELDDLELRRPSLEDRYLELTNEG
jgi:ABC-2 type transport system ATP-binding protein